MLLTICMSTCWHSKVMCRSNPSQKDPNNWRHYWLNFSQKFGWTNLYFANQKALWVNKSGRVQEIYIFIYFQFLNEGRGTRDVSVRSIKKCQLNYKTFGRTQQISNQNVLRIILPHCRTWHLQQMRLHHNI